MTAPATAREIATRFHKDRYHPGDFPGLVCTGCSDLESDIQQALDAAVARERARLEPFTRHHDDCERWQGGCPYDNCYEAEYDESKPCTCGLDAALRAPEAGG